MEEIETFEIIMQLRGTLEDCFIAHKITISSLHYNAIKEPLPLRVLYHSTCKSDYSTHKSSA